MKKVMSCLPGIILLAGVVFAAEQPKPWTVSAEAGAGTILALTGSYEVLNKLHIGIGSGFDVSSFTVGEEKFGSFLLNANIFGEYRVFEKDRMDVRGRFKLGYDWLKVGGYSTSCFEVAPEILAGYRDIYILFSGIFMFTEKPVFVPQIGAGYRFKF